MTSQPYDQIAGLDDTAQVRRAKGLYTWLWLSPLLTVPTLLFIVLTLALNSSFSRSYQAGSDQNKFLLTLLTAVVAVLGSAAWLLVLLTRALDRQNDFVRWHGRQALLLAGARTVVALAAGSLLATGANGQWTVVLSLVLLGLWLIGTLWGQGQAAAGECSLMRWNGQGARLPLRISPSAPAAPTPAAGVQAVFDQALEQYAHSQYDASSRLFRQVLVSGASPALKAQAAAYLPGPGRPASDETADILVALLRFGLDPNRRREVLAALDHLGLVEPL